jgi:hypothetical protein
MIHKLRFAKFAVLAVAGVLCSIPAYGDLIVSTESVSAAQGSTGNTFDVLLTDTGPSSVSIGGFIFEIATSDPDITFTGAFISTATAPYIFAGNSLFGPEIDTQISPSLIAQDLAATGSTSLTSGETVGLGQIFFNVSPTAATGPFAVSFTGGTAGNDLSDPTGKSIPINTFTGGTITINTPEPSSIFLTLAGIAALAALRRRA